MFRRKRRRSHKIPSIPQKPQFAKSKKKKPLLGSFTKLIIIISMLGLFIITGIGVGIVVSFMTNLPNLKIVTEYEGIEAWKFPTKLYSLNGELIAEFAEEKRELIKLEEIPQILKDAVVAVEDNQFYKHKGVDILGILRALWANIRSGKISQGGSTITQQLAKNIFLTQERTYRRKIQEILIAILIERELTKDEILERYFNKIYYGHGNYGVQSASLYYFDNPVKDLTLAEIAMLAGLPSSPVNYSPIAHPQRAIARQAFVLKRMEEEGFITHEQRVEAKNAFAIKVKEISKKKFAKIRTTINKAPYFTEYVRQILEQEYGSNAIYTGGLNVYTTLDLEMQNAATSALWDGLNRLNYEKGKGTPRIEGALLAIDPRTGYIKAMVGGSGFTRQNQLNRAIYAKRQPGSAFKPFIYTTAIDQGFTPASFLVDSPTTYKGANGEIWEPKNYMNKFYGVVTLRTALEYSLNLATIRLLEEVGVNRVIGYAHRMGIKSKLHPDLSLALGTCEVTPIEMTTAFGVFANQGIKVEPIAIKEIKDYKQNLLEERIPKEERVLSPQTAYILTNLMEGVVRRGTARDAVGKRISRVVAGKTGTTDEYVDAWFIGFTPELVATVWIGYDRGQKTLGHGQAGGVVAAPIWADFIEKILHLLESKDFPVPTGITFSIIDPATGLLATKHCPHTKCEVFIENNSPIEYCNIHTEEGEMAEELGVKGDEEIDSSSTTSIEEEEEEIDWENFDKIRLEE
ncbi:MAG: PBP1A family penicillin-binding protein [bacterium]